MNWFQRPGRAPGFSQDARQQQLRGRLGEQGRMLRFARRSKATTSPFEITSSMTGVFLRWPRGDRGTQGERHETNKAEMDIVHL